MVDIPDCCERIVDRVRSSGFEVSCVVFLERGGRLLGLGVAGLFGVKAVGIRVNRPGGGIKALLSGFASRLPVGFRNLLRQIEARLFWAKRADASKRRVQENPVPELEGMSVLIVDDAVDSGSSVLAAVRWCQASGVSPTAIRVACITRTTDACAEYVDVAVYQDMCRFPWSSDSVEYEAWKGAYVGSGGKL